MTEVLTAAQMRATEDAAIAAGAVTGRLLMERAGQGVVDAIRAHWPDLPAGRAMVLCGPGNNGGDGFVVARLLHDTGWQVQVLFAGDAARLPPDAAAMHDLWCALGPVLPLDDAAPAPADSDLCVDALFGAGLSRPVTGGIAAVLRHLGGGSGDSASARPRIVAVDGPSGLCLDSGQVPGQPRDAAGDVLRADLTVTFHAPKAGHVLGLGPHLCGHLVVADIGLRGRAGLPPSGIRLIPPRGDSPSAADRRFDPAGVLGKGQGHKFDHGHAVVLSGPAERSGAARLAARAALRIGAGLVTLAAPAGSAAFIAPALTAVMLRGLKDAGDLTDWLRDDARIGALAIGPGLGLDDRAAALVAAVLAAGRKTVLDADALTLIARDPALRAAVHADCVLTPHGGEFARLWPAVSARLDAVSDTAPLYSRIDAASDAARDIGATVLVKGPDTVIAGPQGQVTIHAAAYGRAAPWLATAGSGDVLAGLIGGLLARGQAPGPAAELAAFLHVEAARAFGPGLIAEDLPEMIPQVLRALGVS